MAIVTKTGSIALLPLQSIGSGSTITGTPLDVSTRFSAFLVIHFGRRTATALTAPVDVRVEGSTDTAGDKNWGVLHQFRSVVTVAESKPVSGTVLSGQKVITLANTNGLALDGFVYIDNATIANSEFGRIAAIATNVSITLEDNLANNQTGSTVYSLAEMSNPQIDLSNIMRVRAVAANRNSDQPVAVEVIMSSGDSIG
jgi:hypothetical protein